MNTMTAPTFICTVIGNRRKTAS